MKTDLNSFLRLSEHMRTWLTYSQIFVKKSSKDEIIKDIRSINVEEALTILAKFSVLDSLSKRELMERLKPFIRDIEIIDSADPFDLINLMYSVKWFIRYGTNKNVSYESRFPKPFHIFITVLKISDYMVEYIDSIYESDEIQDQIQKKLAI